MSLEMNGLNCDY